MSDQWRSIPSRADGPGQGAAGPHPLGALDQANKPWQVRMDT